MALEFHTREHEGIAILEMKGRITAGPEAASLRARVASLDAEESRNVILDLGEVDYIDSTGLGALVICATSMRKRGGAVKLLRLNRRNIELLVMTKLATVFEIFVDEHDAINSFFPGRRIKAFDVLDFVRKLREEEA
jgi:anti-sigma B factor antagonist